MFTLTKELLDNLYWKQWISTHKIAKIVGKSQTTVRKMMLKAGIPLRSNKDRLRVKITPKMLITSYWKRGRTIQEIARELGVSGWTVHQRMIKFGIPRREIGETNLKRPKLPFSGEPLEKVYLLGLRGGDLSARWKGKRIRVEVCTSHPAMLELFRGLFTRYSHVGMCPEQNKWSGIFEWRAFTDLDASFSFLVQKPRSIQTGILGDDLFLGFLAGYTDAEGSLIVSHAYSTTTFIFRICSQDHGLLRDIYGKLLQMGYNPRLTLETEKGIKKGFSELKADYWRLELSRKDEVLQLVQLLPIKHPERKMRRQLMLEIANETSWSKVKDKIRALQARIKGEVKKSIREAASVYNKKYTALEN